MNRWHKIISVSTLSAVLLAGAGTAFAAKGYQSGPNPERFEYIFTQLNLSEQEQTQVIDVLINFRSEQKAKFKEMKSSGEVDFRSLSKEEKQALREEHWAEVNQALSDQLNTVISPEKTSELVKYLDAHRPKFGKGKRNKK